MKVYVITKGSYSAYHIVTVFTDKKQAELFQKVVDYDTEIEEYDSDIVRMNEHDKGQIYRCKRYLSHSEVYSIFEEFNAEEYKEHGEEVFKEVFEVCHGDLTCAHLIVYVRADDNKHAEKIAADKFAEYIARKEGIA